MVLNNFIKGMIILVNLKNERLSITINPFGAELFNLVKDGKEYLWQGDPNVWSGRAYNLFPICGGLKDDEFYDDNNTYKLAKHGFARKTMFKVEYQTETEASFLLSSNDYKDEGYPYEYEFRVVYKLEGETLNVYYKTKNIGNKNMYYSVGAHEGYQIKTDISDYTVIFEKDDNLKRYMAKGNLLSDDTVSLPFNKGVLPLCYDYFEYDALIFKNHNSRRVELKNNKTNESILVEFPDFDYLLIWTKPNGAKFVCIEPWSGLPDTIHSNKQIKDKEGITTLKAGEEKTLLHKITVGGKLN